MLDSWDASEQYPQTGLLLEVLELKPRFQVLVRCATEARVNASTSVTSYDDSWLWALLE